MYIAVYITDRYIPLFKYLYSFLCLDLLLLELFLVVFDSSFKENFPTRKKKAKKRPGFLK